MDKYMGNIMDNASDHENIMDISWDIMKHDIYEYKYIYI